MKFWAQLTAVVLALTCAAWIPLSEEKPAHKMPATPLSSFVEGTFINNQVNVLNPTGPLLAVSVTPEASTRKVYIWSNNNGGNFSGSIRFSLRGTELLILPFNNFQKTPGLCNGSIGTDLANFPNASTQPYPINADTLWLSYPLGAHAIPLAPFYVKIQCDTITVSFESVTNGGFLQSVYLGVYSEVPL